MATAQELREILKYDVERIPLPGDEKVSDGALEVLKQIEGQHVTVERAIAYAQGDVGVRGVKTTDLLRTLQHADGRLALVTWSNAGITSIGYRPNDQRFDVGGYSAVRDMMGDDAEYYEQCSLAKAKDLLASGHPDIVRRDEAGLLEPMNASGGFR